MEKKLIIENIVKKIKSIIINERKSDQLSMQLSRLTVNQFKKNEDFTLESIQFERGDEYANFDFICTFIADENFNFPFSVRGGGDMQTLEIEITYRPDDFPKHMTDLVAEIKETMPLVIREAVSHQIPVLIYNLPVYLNYWDDFEGVDYLEFDNFEKNCEIIASKLDVKLFKPEKEAIIISTYPVTDSIIIKNPKHMNRQELVLTASKAGIKKASTIKSNVLEQMIAEFNNNNNLKIKVMEPGTTKQKGRPVVEGSARQARLAARAARVAANGGVVKRGRPAKAKDTEAAA